MLPPSQQGLGAACTFRIRLLIYGYCGACSGSSIDSSYLPYMEVAIRAAPVLCYASRHPLKAAMRWRTVAITPLRPATQGGESYTW